jgi:two-component system chemotaxis sensor kinase CheA
VVSSGAYKYGLVVGQLHDSEEIVVKPVGRHLKRCTAFAGATVMGDGKVALIIDIASLAQMAELSTLSEVNKLTLSEEDMVKTGKEKAALLTFKNLENEFFAVPLNRVERIERIQTAAIEHIGERKVVQYRGGALPLCELSQFLDIAPLAPGEQQEIIVFKVSERELGLMVTPPLDTVEVFFDADESTLKQPGISGSMIIRDHTTLIIDVFELARVISPEWFD